MRISIAWIVAIIGLVFFSADCDAQPEKDEMALREFFSSEDHSMEPLILARERMPKICLEVGDKAIPILSEVIRHVTPSNAGVASIALNCLVRIGGRDVVQLLGKMYDESNDEAFRHGIRAARCKAMQSTGTPEDVQFLISSLTGPLLGREALAPSAAAYALAVLKPEAAKSALEKRAAEFKNTVPEEVEFALDRINGRKWSTPQADSATDTDTLILSVFRFGIPHITMSDTFVEQKANRIWKRAGIEWSYQSLNSKPKDENLPYISFDVFVTKDGTRAICSVGISCGNVCGYGYDFILRKDDAVWRVVGLFPTMIS